MSSWHPFKVVSWCMASNTNCNSASWTLLVELFCTGQTASAWGGCILKGAAWVWVGQFAWMGTGPRSHPLSSQSPDPGWGLPAGPVTSHRQSYRWPVDHPLPGPRHAGYNCMPQWESWGPPGQPPAWPALPLQWLRCVCPRCWAHTWARTPSTRHPHQCWPSPPCNIVENYDWEEETPVCGLGNGSWPRSDTCWHRRWWHLFHCHWPGRGPLPGQTHKHWCVAWKA